jgi:urea transport system substrate-binding protein
LWKKAVEKAGSFDIDKIHAAHGGIELPNAPEGYVRIHDTNQHLWSKAKMGKMLKNGQIEVVAVSDELIEPDPFPKGYQ